MGPGRVSLLSGLDQQWGVLQSCPGTAGTMLGIEPACSAFDIGNRGCSKDNPISREGEPTAIPIRPTVAYALSALGRTSGIDGQSNWHIYFWHDPAIERGRGGLLYRGSPDIELLDHHESLRKIARYAMLGFR